MYKLIYFIRKFYVAIIFFILEIIAIACYLNSTPYTESRLIAANNAIFGTFNRFATNTVSYFSLRRENAKLVEQIAELQNRLNDYVTRYPEPIEVGQNMRNLHHIAAKVMSNSLNRNTNYIVLNKGEDDGVRINMAVLTVDGYAVGSITNCTQHYSIARSLLNTDQHFSVRLGKDHSVGSLYWAKDDAYTVRLDDVSKYAQIERGETVEASGFSLYFPAGTRIGTIEEAVLDGMTYKCRVRLSADIARLQSVILVDNSEIDEVKYMQENPLPATEE
ncbi:MAG: rod shape-determining protein MreC [Alistipes sp.]|nr:rod shape-determining protein MreC [Alistipes sp.]